MPQAAPFTRSPTLTPLPDFVKQDTLTNPHPPHSILDTLAGKLTPTSAALAILALVAPEEVGVREGLQPGVVKEGLGLSSDLLSLLSGGRSFRHGDYGTAFADFGAFGAGRAAIRLTQDVRASERAYTAARAKALSIEANVRSEASRMSPPGLTAKLNQAISDLKRARRTLRDERQALRLVRVVDATFASASAGAQFEYGHRLWSGR